MSDAEITLEIEWDDYDDAVRWLQRLIKETHTVSLPPPEVRALMAELDRHVRKEG